MSATVGELLSAGARRFPGRTAVKTWTGAQLTYRELDERTTRLANALAGLGLRRGDRVAAWMEDGLEYVELYLAAAKAGVVVAPINARLRPREAAFQLGDADPRALIWTPGLAEEVAQLDLAGGLVTVACARGEVGADHLFEELVAAGDPRPGAPPGAADPFILGYTSGTTGRPKGAVLTHRSTLAIARLNASSYRLPEASVAAFTGSMSFVATVPAHILSHLQVGGTTVLMGRWTADELVDAVERERATFTYLPSPLIDDFIAAASARPASWESLRSVLHSASRVPPEKLRTLAELVGERMVEGWGMTENSGGLVTATSAADVTGADEALDIWSSVGRPVAEIEVEAIDEDGAAVPHDGRTVGELVARSPALMDGYWNQPEATAAALRDGWYHTGDMGTIDPGGYVYLVERRTDLIVSGGMNIYPRELEDAICELPGVRECAVVGVPHERWGQTPMALVVAAESGGPSPEEVLAHCRERLAGYKKPTAVELVDALPRTTSLKVDRGALRALAERLIGRAEAPG